MQVVQLFLGVQEGTLGLDKRLDTGHGRRLLTSRDRHPTYDIHQVLRLLSSLVSRRCELLRLDVGQAHARDYTALS